MTRLFKSFGVFQKNNDIVLQKTIGIGDFVYALTNWKPTKNFLNASRLPRILLIITYETIYIFSKPTCLIDTKTSLAVLLSSVSVELLCCVLVLLIVLTKTRLSRMQNQVSLNYSCHIHVSTATIIADLLSSNSLY